MVRLDQADLIYKTEDAKFDAVVEDIAERYETGPAGARRHHLGREVREAVARCSRSGASPTRCSTPSSTPGRREIVAQAGRLDAVTVATNMAGRGVDILLGGNPEGLADARGRSAEGLDPETDEGQARATTSCSTQATRPSAEAEGDKVRELGGLYVLGTERHESRRIDNQLRGRSGRQGDPGESRFYLSLEDELMRLFATGAMNWVMGKALPDDVPIEAKMVTKAIERAQNTVEQRNAEIRKNVLKYDEVMNEQRKVIYKRRDQILDGADLRDEAHRVPRRGGRRASIGTYCVADFAEEWDLEGLVTEIADATGRPSITVERPRRRARPPTSCTSCSWARPPRYYEQREAELGADDDARGRAPGDAADHRPALARAPLRDGLPAGGHQPAGHGPEGPARRVAARGLRDVRPDDARHRPGLRAVRHARAGRRSPSSSRRGRPSATCSTPRPTTRPRRRHAWRAAAARRRPQLDGERGGRAEAAEEPSSTAPVVKSDWDKTPRNAPCPCGSGKKFKLCHGALSGQLPTMRDFSDDLAALRRRLDEAHGLPADRRAARAAGPSSRPRRRAPTSGTTPTRPGRSTASWPR